MLAEEEAKPPRLLVLEVGRTSSIAFKLGWHGLSWSSRWPSCGSGGRGVYDWVMKPVLSSIDASPDTSRPLHEQRWIELNRLAEECWESLKPDSGVPPRVTFQAPCCCDDPDCRETIPIDIYDRDEQAVYVAPGHRIIQPDHLDASSYSRSIGHDGWTEQAPFLDHLGRPAYGLSHPARRRLEEMLESLSEGAGIEEPSLVIAPAESFGPTPYVSIAYRTITVSVELLDYFSGRIEILDSVLGHEITHIRQYDEGREVCSGPAAERDADCAGARLTGYRREKWALEYLYEFLTDIGHPAAGENDVDYPPLEERLAALDKATRDLPLAPFHELEEPSLAGL